MTVASFENVYEQLEEEYAWRRDEIRLLHNQLEYIDDQEQKARYRKAIIAMLYSHFEGFCYTSLLLYIDTINILKIKRSEANENLVTASMANIFRDYENKERKSDFFSKIEDSKIHHFYRQVEFLTKLNDFLSEEVNIPSIVVNTENNIGFDVLRKILFRLGLPYESFQEHSGEIAILLRVRNDIAHGKMRVGVEERDYERVEQATVKVMRGLIQLIMDSLNNKRFLKKEKS